MSESIIISLFDGEKYGLPNDFEEVINKVIALEDIETQPSQNILAFAKEAEEYCKIYEGFDEESLIHCIEEQETAVVNIELSSDDDYQILLNYLVETALKHHLVCFIEDLVIAFVPPKQIYPPTQKELWEDLKNYAQKQQKKPKTLDQFRNLVEPLFDKILPQYHFTKIPVVSLVREHYCQFLRIHGDIHQIIQLRFQPTSKSFYSFMEFNLYLDAVKKVRIHFNFKDKVSKGNPDYNFYFDSPTLLNSYLLKAYEVFNTKPSEEKLRPIISEVVKILDSIMTIQDLDKFIDSDMYNVNRVLQSYRSSEIPDILILSKLTNHPDFEKRVLLAETAPVQIWGWGEDRVIYPQELKKLIKYLREEVSPIIESNS